MIYVYANIILTWLMFAALFPISFIWLRHAYRVYIKKDYRDASIKRGNLPALPEKLGRQEALFNLIGGTTLLGVIIGVLGWQLPYDTWTAVAGSTIVCKLFTNIALVWRANKLLRANA